MGPSIGSSTQSPDGASLRPRARKLNSGLDDEQSSTKPYTRFESGSAHASSSSADVRHESFESAAPGRNGTTKAMSGTWSQLSGIAAGIFGNPSREGSPQRKRDPRHSLPAYSTSTLASSWGPPLQHKDIGSGSTDKRAAKLRDEKRKAMLTGDSQPFRGAVGHKRRTSDDFTGQNLVQEDAEQELFVYVHHVRPGDTLPGISIKYSCQINALRKANRIWPNDPIHSRKLIFVPVDASAIKGKPYSGQEYSVEEDLLGDETITLHESPQLSRSPKQGASAFADAIPAAPLSPASTSNNTESEYKHESWVMLPNDTSPTEIARLCRQNLGYFPRARRKSIGFSDRSTSRNTSFDLGRTVQSSPLIRPQDSVDPQARSSSLASSSTISATTRRALSNTRPTYTATRTRSSSNPATTASASSSFLRGPGGVGTMGRNVRTIGPGNERLTELFGHHFYSVEPPRNQTVFTPWTPSLILEHEDGIVRTNGVPIASSSGGTGAGLQDVGGAIEGWVRKFAKRAATALDNTPGHARSLGAASSTSAGVAGNGSVTGALPGVGSRGKHRATNAYRDEIGSGVGDLIELVDSFDITPHAHPSQHLASSLSAAHDGTTQAAQDAPVTIPEFGGSSRTKAAIGVSAANGAAVRGRKSTRPSDD